MIPKLIDFMGEIKRVKTSAHENGKTGIVISSRELLKDMGDYRGKDARMASSCCAMYKSMRAGD